MASMRHPHIVAFMGVCTTPPAIVTEYCERGSLTSLLQAAKVLPDRAAELTWRFCIKMVGRGWVGDWGAVGQLGRGDSPLPKGIRCSLCGCIDPVCHLNGTFGLNLNLEHGVESCHACVLSAT
jgi:hypothetical protein